MSLPATLTRYEPTALAVLRIIAGVTFLEHGLVKLFGFPPGAMPGVQAPLTFLWVAGVIELVAGALVTVGWFTRFAAFIAAGEIAVGYWTVHAPKSFYPAVNMGDAAILFCFVFLYLVFAGPGAFSIDRTARVVEVSDTDRQ